MTREEVGKRVRDALSKRLDLPHNPAAEAVLVEMAVAVHDDVVGEASQIVDKGFFENWVVQDIEDRVRALRIK